MYDSQDVHKRISKLRMKPYDSLKDFVDIFLHLCYEFPEGDVNWDILNENLRHLVQIS